MFQLYILHPYKDQFKGFGGGGVQQTQPMNLQLYFEDIIIKFVFEMVDSLCYCYFSSILTTSIQMIFPFYLEFSYSYTTNLLLSYLL